MSRLLSGTIFSGAAPLSGQFPLTVTIGGVHAPVVFAGISGAGLYQLNVMVPQIASGDQAIQATIGSDSTQAGVVAPIQ